MPWTGCRPDGAPYPSASWWAWSIRCGTSPSVFIIPGTWQACEVVLGTQRFWFYMLTIVVEAVLYTWIYNNTNRSTLAAVLFHFTGNAFGELFALSPRAEWFNFLFALATVVLVIGFYGPRTLTREKKDLCSPPAGSSFNLNGKGRPGYRAQILPMRN